MDFNTKNKNAKFQIDSLMWKYDFLDDKKCEPVKCPMGSKCPGSNALPVKCSPG